MKLMKCNNPTISFTRLQVSREKHGSTTFLYEKGPHLVRDGAPCEGDVRRSRGLLGELRVLERAVLVRGELDLPAVVVSDLEGAVRHLLDLRATACDAAEHHDVAARRPVLALVAFVLPVHETASVSVL